VRPLMKPAIWAVTLCILAVGLIISGAHVAQSRTASLQTLPGADFIITATLTTTPTITLTATPVSTPTATLTPTPTPSPIEVVIEEPDIYPTYAGMCDSYWYSYTNNRGFDAFLTLNVTDTANSTNWGEWRPDISQPGYYLVEAYIPFHPPIPWECPEKPISFDTSDARYIIQHATGQTLITGTQKSYSNEWLPLGEYLFRVGSEGYVALTDLNGEENLTTTVSFSALRFTWQRSSPASIYLPLTSKVASTVVTSTVSIQNAPAFDRCHLPTISQMQTWWNSSPYRITNVYIGGDLLYHECTVPDADWIETVRDQGWGMIPTWVGPQAPCSDYRLRMSSDPAIAFQQGQAEADAASLAAWQIGLSGYGMSGTIIYYDVEGYSIANQACRDAVKSFISGWTERMHYWGNRAGAYGGGCTSYVRDWAEATYPPENLWVADWYSMVPPDVPPKDPMDVPLFGLTCLSDNLWPNHQRIRQYRAGHNETWGHVTFNIDSNLADAEVVAHINAIARLINSTSLSSSTPEIFDYSSLSDTQDQSWLIADGILYNSNVNGQNWQPILNISNGLAMRKVFFVDRSQGWLIAASNQENYSFFSTSNGGESWLEINTLPVDPGWLPHSIQFTNKQSGWIVLKKQTRSIFSVGRLLHTADGGKSWQTLDMPIGEAVRFISTEIGWTAGGVGGQELYQTQDGGRTWRSVVLPLPKGSTNTILLPAFKDPQTGILPVVIVEQDETRLEMFSTRDGGETWQWSYTVTSLPEGLTSVSFTTPQVGWGVSNIGVCQTADNGEDCSLQAKLLRTQDGGMTWEFIETP
jgi:photosystem II stability/assembly factor-like uncharacterized protein